MRQVRPAPRTLSAGSVDRSGVTVQRVRLGPNVVKVRVGRSDGVQIGDGNRQLNNYRYKFERPRVSVDRVLEGHPARLRAFAKLVANPRSTAANSAFRRHLSAAPTRPSRVRFADTARSSVQITARVDEYGALVVDKSRGVQVGDNSTQRNDFSYKLAGEEISLERMLHDRPDLARGLAMTVRYPGNPAVQRSFTRRLSNEIIRGNEPSLKMLNQDRASSSLSVDGRAGVQLGVGNSRTDKVDVKLGRFVVTGWDSLPDRVAVEADRPTVGPRPIDPLSLVKRLFTDPDPGIARMQPSTRHRLDHLDDRDDPGAIGPARGPAIGI